MTERLVVVGSDGRAKAYRPLPDEVRRGMDEVQQVVSDDGDDDPVPDGLVETVEALVDASDVQLRGRAQEVAGLQ